MEPRSIMRKILEQIRDELVEIRDEARKTNVRLDQTNERLDHTRDDMNAGFAALGDRIMDVEVRLDTGLMALAGTVNQVKAHLTGHRSLDGRVQSCEKDIVLLKKRTGLK